MPLFKVIGSSHLSEKQFDEVDATEIRLDSGLEPDRNISWLFSVGSETLVEHRKGCRVAALRYAPSGRLLHLRKVKNRRIELLIL